jgi:hypothetical protein
LLLDITREENLLIVTVDKIDTIFYILKPKLIDTIIKDFKGCDYETQVIAYASGLIAMGALEVV